jgi:predicted RNA-binding protein YlxR (DUF448 family)
VAKKVSKRIKHIPQRTCVGCRQVLPKRTFIRIVRTTDGVKIDPTGKAAGRGAYLHQKRSCWEQAMKGMLASALKIELTDQDRVVLLEFMQNLPEEDMNTAE